MAMEARAGAPWRGYALAFLTVAAVSAVLLPFRALLAPNTVMLLYVPVIIAVASLAGVRASATAAVLAFLTLDFLFVPPYYRLTVASVAEWLGLLVFLIVALVSGQQAARLRARETAAVRRQGELELLNRLAFRIASEKSASAVAQFLVSQVVEVLDGVRAVLYAGRLGEGPECLAQAGLERPSGHEAEFVSWVLATGKAVGMPGVHGVPYDQRIVSVGAEGAVTGAVADAAYLPLQTSTGIEGVLVAELAPGVALTGDDARVLSAVANLAAASLERQRLEGEAAHVVALREADGLKTTLVRSVSHELKTPLAAATARVTGLVDEGGSCSAERVHDELMAVAEDLSRLDDSIGALLDLSRLESDTWQPRMEMEDIRDLLGTVRSKVTAGRRDRLMFVLPENLPEVEVDHAQLTRAISNLVENALAYTPPDTTVTIGAERAGANVRIWVQDQGAGVPDSEKAYVFEKFYRGSNSTSVPSGTGLGLAIAREIVRTHAGTLTVEDAVPNGARFVMTLPAATPEAE